MDSWKGGRWCAGWMKGLGGARGGHGYLEIWDGVLAVVFIGEQALKLLIRLLAAGQVASICRCTPCTHKPFRQSGKPHYNYNLHTQTYIYIYIYIHVVLVAALRIAAVSWTLRSCW